MSYNIMRTGKIKDRKQITDAASHNFRTRHQPNIDKTKKAENLVIWNPLEVDTTKASDLQKKVTGYYEGLGVKERSNSVLMQEFVISASPEFFEGLSVDKVTLWAKHQLKFMQKEFGENLKIGVLHLDEKTPHLHFLLTCEEKSLKRYKNQKGEFFKEGFSLNAKRWGPDFLRDLHTRHAQHNEVLGLKRGQPRPETRHKPLKEYYRELEAKEAEFIKATKSEQEKTRLLSQARNYIKAAKEIMDAQFNDIIELIDIATNHALNPAETERINKIAASAMKGKSMGGQPPKPPTKGV